jgi:alkylhydroperoxidase family enzyme
MARITPPEGGMSVFDHHPDLWASFNRFYGYLWTYGALDQPTKEAARMRNARVTGCPVCRNLRFAGAREQGLSEDYVELIVDGYEKSDLPDRWKAAVRWTDAVIGYPAAISDEERAEVAADFTPAEFAELTLTAAVAQGFSKSVVAWGGASDMPTAIVPTPTPDGTVTDGS